MIGRVGLVLFVAVLLEVVGSSFVLEQADVLSSEDAQAQRVADQLDAASRVMSVIATAQRGMVARTLSEPGLALEWSPARVVPPAADDHPSTAEAIEVFRAKLLEHEPSLGQRDPRVWAVDAKEGGMRGDLRLADGSALVFHATRPRGDNQALLRRLSSIILLSGCVLLAALVVVRTLAAPLRILATAADAIGHGPSIEIIETGPGEVRRVARAFNAMQGRIAKLISDRTEALAAVSHDLRTPISRMRLRAGFLESTDDRNAFEDDLAEMEAMLNALLAYLGGENDPERPRKTDLAAILGTLVDAATDAGHAASYDGPDHCVLLVRVIGLKRALSNVINNAIAYGGVARVSLRQDETRVVIIVDDDGPGLAVAEMGAVFEPFYRADASRDRTTGGMGLGLSIALQAIRREKGDIELANRVEGGLRVEIGLPRRVEG